MFSTFYNETIRKTVIGFGSLFDDIYIQKINASGQTTKKILVPISYSPKEKFIRCYEFPFSGDKQRLNWRFTKNGVLDYKH